MLLYNVQYKKSASVRGTIIRAFVVKNMWLFRRQNLSAHFTESDTHPVFLRKTSHDHGVAILDEFALRTVVHFQRFCSFPRQFEHRSIRIRCRSGNSSRAHQIAAPNITTLHCVVCQLLCHVPVHVLEIGGTDLCFVSIFRL